MRRELKVCAGGLINKLHCKVAKHIPMRRELKAYRRGRGLANPRVAKHIPMRRELKVHVTHTGCWLMQFCRKAHPDEKGTERGYAVEVE